jgi:hypothetical protein
MKTWDGSQALTDPRFERGGGAAGTTVFVVLECL